MSADDTIISPELVEIALERVEGFAFERFANEFLSTVEGRSYTPLGGVGDGGADGLRHDELYETDKAGLFYQITIQKNHRNKVRQTVARLKEFGRSPGTVYYVTSRLIPHIDIEEENLSEELDTNIRIRDKNSLLSR